MLASRPFERSASARDRILLQAERLFYQEGIRATGIDRIIAEACVTKVTFYRHFPAKQTLVEAFLAARHQRWIAAFSSLLAQQMAQHGQLAVALPATLSSWFREPDYRGCAFINAAAELAGSQPACLAQIQAHKLAMRTTIGEWLTEDRQAQLAAICMLVEGAIVQVQMGQAEAEVTESLGQVLAQILGAQP